jgi:hypothetical protein
MAPTQRGHCRAGAGLDGGQMARRRSLTSLAGESTEVRVGNFVLTLFLLALISNGIAPGGCGTRSIGTADHIECRGEWHIAEKV